ncbi:MAG: DUF1800 family protein [Solirubrobacteraceae bacterium]
MASLEKHILPLGEKHAKHLLRRASFKYTKVLIDQLKVLTPTQALDFLTIPTSLIVAKPYDPDPLGAPYGFFTDITDPAHPAYFLGTPKRTSIVSAWWWYNAINAGTLEYKLSHFLSTKFTVEKSNGASGSALEFYDHVCLLLFYSYGNFKKFAKRMCLDNTMSAYLGNNFNRKNSPNENYAREFFELFTIGKGKQIEPGNYTNYTENDIVEAAKLLTGIRRRRERDIIDTETNIASTRYNFPDHKLGQKKFSAAFNNKIIDSAINEAGMDAELTEFVEMVFGKIETAKHFCRRLYIYFVRSTISQEVEQDIITPLAQELYNNNYEILPIVRKLLESKHFYDLDDSNSEDEVIGGIIKSPLQLFSETFTYLNCTTKNPNIIAETRDFYIFFWDRFVHNTFFSGANMLPFDPETVAGHSAYHQSPEFDKAWISAATLISRYRMGESLIEGRNKISPNADIKAKIDIVTVIKDAGIISNPSDPNILCKELCDALFGQIPTKERVDYFKNSFLLKDAPGNQDFYWTSEWNKFLSTNNKSVVEPRLKELIIKIISAPEFQLF